MERIRGKLFHVAFIAGLLASSLSASEPPGYYAAAAGKTGEAFRQSLHAIVSGHYALPYDSTRTDTTPCGISSFRQPSDLRFQSCRNFPFAKAL